MWGAELSAGVGIVSMPCVIVLLLHVPRFGSIILERIFGMM